jgi:hypothetical protein
MIHITYPSTLNQMNIFERNYPTLFSIFLCYMDLAQP